METTAGERGPWLEQNSLNSLCRQHEKAFLACLSLTLSVEAGEMIILAFFSLLGWPQSTCAPLQWVKGHRKKDNSYAFREQIIHSLWGQSTCSPLTLVSCAPTDKTLAFPNPFWEVWALGRQLGSHEHRLYEERLTPPPAPEKESLEDCSAMHLRGYISWPQRLSFYKSCLFPWRDSSLNVLSGNSIKKTF